jgi:beta-lactam-binding protein with PASTA domain/tRNA A-37 threonylcarbamoyl transferase component Bud32
MSQFADRPDRRSVGDAGMEHTTRRALPTEDSPTTVDPDAMAPMAYPEKSPVSPSGPASQPSPTPEPAPVSPPSPGSGPRLLGGRYELGEVLGRGGMAEVRQARDARLGRQVAIKELRVDLASDPTFQARFRREAQSAAGLNHPNIVAVYDTGESTDPATGLAIPFIVMELVEGQTFRDILKEGRKILPERALELTRGVLDALSYSHRSGIIHRDIKPANVMLTPQGTVKVMDFGIARAISETATSMTQTAAVIGTAQYLSPEQARGETVDARSDIYSAGCLLFELLVGRPPFVGDSPVSVAYQHVRELPVPPSQLDPAVGPEIDAITLTALAKEPGDRFQSARAMADDIDRLLAGEQVLAVTRSPASAVSAPEPTKAIATAAATQREVEKPRRSRMPAVMGILVSVLALLLAGGAAWFYLGQPEQPSQTQPQLISAPNVVGKERAEAESQISAAGLDPEVREIEGLDDTTVGTVIRQDPGANAQLNPNQTVVLEVNIGPKKITIPSGLTGQHVDQVRQTLREAGFTDVRARPAGTETGNPTKDTVLDIEPGPGQAVTVDTPIVLWVATGSSSVPNWIGWNQASVDQDRQSKGFTNVIFETRETADPARVGTVLETSPAAGTRIGREDQITVVIGRAQPAPSPTPVVPTPVIPTPEIPTIPTPPSVVIPLPPGITPQ